MKLNAEFVKVLEVGFSSTPTGIINESASVAAGIAGALAGRAASPAGGGGSLPGLLFDSAEVGLAAWHRGQ